MTEINTMTNTHWTTRVRGRGQGIRPLVRMAAAALVLAVAVAGCSTDEILKVQDPDVLSPATLNTPEALPTVIAGAIGNFERAYQGPGDGNESSGQIGYSGLLADEFISSGTFPTRHEIDQRNIAEDNGSNETMFDRLSQARAAADLAARRFAQFAPDSASHALALALDGEATVLFGEDYCSGVPFSTIEDDGSLTFGSPLSTTEIFQRAIAKFDTALAVAGITPEFTNLAKIGKGRALLDLGQYADAAAAVAGVPDDFAYMIESSSNTSREANGVWWFQYVIARLSLGDKEGGNGLDYISSNDPRIPVLVPRNSKGVQQVGQDGSTPLFEQAKYPDRDSDVPLATGIEARLIEAEAAMQGGDDATFLAKLNAARAAAVASVEAVSGDTTTLPPLTAADIPADPNAKVDLLFRERAFDLWLTAHRLGDLRRLIRQYGRTADQVFPTGPWFKGGTYHDDVSMPVPQHEENNPNFTACDPTVA